MASYVYVTQQKKRYADVTVDAVFDCICQRLGITQAWPWSPKNSIASSSLQGEHASAHGSFGSNTLPNPSTPSHIANGASNDSQPPRQPASLGSSSSSTPQSGSQAPPTQHSQPSPLPTPTHSPTNLTAINALHYASAPTYINGTPTRAIQATISIHAAPASPVPVNRTDLPHNHEIPSIHYTADSSSGPVGKNSHSNGDERFLASGRSEAQPNTYDRQEPPDHVVSNPPRATSSMPNMTSSPTATTRSNPAYVSLQAASPLSEEEALEEMKAEYFRPASDEEIDVACKVLRKALFNVDRSRIFVFNHIKSSDRYAKVIDRFAQKTGQQWTSAFPLFFFAKSIPKFLENILVPHDDVTLTEDNRVFTSNPALIHGSARYVLICDAIREFVDSEASPTHTINFAGVVLPLFLVERKM